MLREGSPSNGELPIPFAVSPYLEQETQWPQEGRHILASCNDFGVVVYQSWGDAIADYILEHQKLEGCPNMNPTRMAWLKTNFLWAVFRNGWNQKPQQERTLAFRIKWETWDTLLRSLYVLGRRDRKVGVKRPAICQWDPDHFPSGEAHPTRRAIQIGIRGMLLEEFRSGKWFVEVVDVTGLVKSQRQNAERELWDRLVIPAHCLIVPKDAAVKENLGREGATELTADS